MEIRKINFHNWRSLREAQIDVQNLLILIGKNNHGKSNILYGLLYFFGKWECSKADFCGDSENLSVSVVFSNLSLKEKSMFGSFVDSHGSITLKRQSTKNMKTEYFILNTASEYEKRDINPEIFGEILFLPAIDKGQSHSEKSSFHLLSEAFIGSLWRKNPDDFKRNRLQLERKLNELLLEWGTRIEIVTKFQKKSEKPKISVEIWVDDHGVPDILTKGHGFQRALLFAFFDSFLSFSQQTHNSFFLLFEEPELFLHPQAQSELFIHLKELAQKGVNICLTTHSSYFIDLTYYRSICIVQKSNLQEGTKVRQVLGNIFPREAERKNFNMTYWINPDRGELFFAKKVILVEGPTEKVILPKLAKKLGISHYEFTIIDCAGKSNMPLYISLLNAFQIPYIALYDKDHQYYRSRKAKFSMSMNSGFIEKKIRRSIGGSVVLVNDIEEELGIRDHGKKNKPFFALQYITRKSFVIPKSLMEKLKKIFE